MSEDERFAGLPRVYKLTEVAEYLGWSKTTMYDVARSGRIRLITPNGHVKGARVTEDELRRYMRESEESYSPGTLLE